MTAKIIDFAQKRKEKLQKIEAEEMQILSDALSDLSVDEFTQLSLDELRNYIILSAIARGDSVYKSDGHTTVMHNGMAWAIPDLKDDPNT